MPCPTALAGRLGLSGAVTGTNIKPCTHAVQCNNYPIPPLISWSRTTPSSHRVIIRHHVVPNSLKAIVCLQSSRLFRIHTPSLTTDVAATEVLLQQGAHHTGNSSQQAASADGEVGGRVGGRAGAAGAAGAGGRAGAAALGVVRGRGRGRAGRRCPGGAAGGRGRVGRGVLAGQGAELGHLTLGCGRAGVVGAVVVAAGLRVSKGARDSFFPSYIRLAKKEGKEERMGYSRRDGLVRGTLARVVLVSTLGLAGLCAGQAVLHDVVGFAGGRRGRGCCGGGLGQDGNRGQEGEEGDEGLHVVCCFGWFEAWRIMYVIVQGG